MRPYRLDWLRARHFSESSNNGSAMASREACRPERPIRLWQLSFAHLQRSRAAILAAKLRCLKRDYGWQAALSPGLIEVRNELVRTRPT
jgi:hypothetical protein